MRKPIIDKAEVSIDFPNKYYQGSFGRGSRYDVTVDTRGIHIDLERGGQEKRKVAFHLHHHLFSGVLESIADELSENDALEALDRQQLREAVSKLAKVLGE